MHYVILVCDDEEDVGYVKQAFESLPGDIDVVTFGTAASFFEYINAQHSSNYPFLVIVNHYVADADTLDLLRSIKKDDKYKLLPVAMMSGFASESLIREYYLAGANCFYKKPFDQHDWNHMADCLVTLFHN
jgi:two-component system, response regulator